MNAPIRFAPLVVLLVCAVPLRAAEPPVNLAYEPYVVWNDRGIPNGRLGFLKANGTSTRGNYAVVVRGPYEAPGPEAHTHSHVFEGWYILQGSLKFQSRERIFDAPPFTFVLVPPGVEHRFWTEPGQLVQVVQILAPPGFEFLPRGTEYSFANVASEEDAHLLHWESTPRIPAP
jgi:mannose-6-phosphate isomerase-like protein (cupin superfamily)